MRTSKCGLAGQGMSADKRWYCHIRKHPFGGNVLEIDPLDNGRYAGDRISIHGIGERPSKDIKSLIDALRDLLKNRCGK